MHKRTVGFGALSTKAALDIDLAVAHLPLHLPLRRMLKRTPPIRAHAPKPTRLPVIMRKVTILIPTLAPVPARRPNIVLIQSTIMRGRMMRLMLIVAGRVLALVLEAARLRRMVVQAGRTILAVGKVMAVLGGMVVWASAGRGSTIG